MMKLLVLAGLVASVVGAASPAFADWDRDARHYGHHDRHRPHFYRPPLHHHDRVVIQGDDWRVRISSGHSYRPSYHYPRVIRETRVVTPVVYQPVVVQAPVYQAQPVMVAAPASATFIDTVGRTCREYQSTIRVQGRNQPAYGTACLGADGAWVVSD